MFFFLSNLVLKEPQNSKIKQLTIANLLKCTKIVKAIKETIIKSSSRRSSLMNSTRVNIDKSFSNSISFSKPELSYV